MGKNEEAKAKLEAKKQRQAAKAQKVDKKRVKVQKDGLSSSSFSSSLTCTVY